MPVHLYAGRNIIISSGQDRQSFENLHHAMFVFQAEKIVKQFNGNLALNQVSLDVPEQSIYGLLGPNGAGKTTLIRIINRITAPDSGRLFLNGHELSASDIYTIGYLPEERGLYKKMKVGEQAVYLARLKGLSKQESLSRIKHWFEVFEIRGWWNKKIEELSKGMQQKIQFIVTILHEPKLLIFDEPFSGFDPINTAILKKEVLALRDKGATVLFSTHDMGSVEQLCDHITLIDKGRTILQGEINDIRSAYKSDTYEVRFTGDINLVRPALKADFELVEQSTTGGTGTAKIRIMHHSNGNELLALLINKIHILSFNELIPGMNDIFIRAVKDNT